MEKKTKTFLLILLSAVLLLSGCGKAAQKPVPDTTPESGVQQTSDSEKRIMASRFSNLALQVNGVQKATVVVANPGTTNGPGSDILGQGSSTAQMPNANAGTPVVMVGVNLDPKAMQDKNRENSIKEEVKAKIIGSGAQISQVLVTTDPNMIKKLQDVAAGIIQGQPLQSYAQDINELDKNIRAQ